MYSKVGRLLRNDTPSIVYFITTFYTLFRSLQVKQDEARLWLTICTTIALLIYVIARRSKGYQSSDQLDVESGKDEAFVIVIMLAVLAFLAYLVNLHDSSLIPLFGSLASALVLSALVCWKAS